MNRILEPLIVDFVAWVARTPRPYAEALEVWRTSCPRLTVWEDAHEQGFVVRCRDSSNGLAVIATARGHALLRAHGRTGA